jgi:hypothetical protein
MTLPKKARALLSDEEARLMFPGLSIEWQSGAPLSHSFFTEMLDQWPVQ